MINQDKQTRRIGLRKIFQEKKFKLVAQKEKADEFRHEAGGVLYLFWDQGKEPNIAIDPRIEYSGLLKLNGVVLKKMRELPDGLRYSATMKEFPKEYESFDPKDKKSHVGRMFAVREDVLSSFLSGLTLHYQNRGEPSILASPVSANTEGNQAKKELNLLPPDQLHTEDNHNDRTEYLRVELEGESIQIGVEYANKPGEDVDAIVKRRIGQGPFRSLLEEIYGVSCCVSGVTNRKLLIASHIVPWSKASPTQKTDPENGLLLSVSWDALFDKGFVSFDDDGMLLCSKTLGDDTAHRLGISMAVRLPASMLSEVRKKNLFWHRKKHGFEI